MYIDIKLWTNINIWPVSGIYEKSIRGIRCCLGTAVCFNGFFLEIVFHSLLSFLGSDVSRT